LAKTQLGNSTGLEILANIMKHCDVKTTRHIMNGLQRDVPHVVQELRKKILMFEDLAFADARGVQKLLKLIRVRDLAVSLKGAAPAVLKNLANNMSQRGISDLKEEITMIGTARESDVNAARERIMLIVNELVDSKEMFINRSDSDLVY